MRCTAFEQHEKYPEGKSHPNQEIYRDEHGTIRFCANPLVEYLLDNGGIDMNHLMTYALRNNDITCADFAQFSQIIGYSVSSWGFLSYVSQEHCTEIDKLAKLLTEENSECSIF